jgi:hypothetical protein
VMTSTRCIAIGTAIGIVIGTRPMIHHPPRITRRYPPEGYE